MTWREQMFSTLGGLAGVTYEGAQERPTKGRPILLYTEPRTGSTFGVDEADVSLPAVRRGAASVLERFGIDLDVNMNKEGH